MGKSLKIPVFVKTDDGSCQIPPGTDCYYLLTSDGLFLFKRGGIVESMVRVATCPPSLARQEPWAELAASKLPFSDFARILNFFRAVQEKHHTEAVVILFYNQTEKAWHVEVPKQNVSSAGVSYTDGFTNIDGFLKAGTVHSHSSFGAFHSGGDDHDEKHFDGLHVTIGNVSDAVPSISVSVMANGTRFKKDLDEYLEGVSVETVEVDQSVTEEKEEMDVPEFVSLAQADRISRDSDSANTSLRQFFKGILGFQDLFPITISQKKNNEKARIESAVLEGEQGLRITRKRKRYVTTTQKVSKTQIVFRAPDGKCLEDFPFPPEWMENVHKNTPVVVRHAVRHAGFFLGGTRSPETFGTLDFVGDPSDTSYERWKNQFRMPLSEGVREEVFDTHYEGNEEESDDQEGEGEKSGREREED